MHRELRRGPFHPDLRPEVDDQLVGRLARLGEHLSVGYSADADIDPFEVAESDRLGHRSLLPRPVGPYCRNRLILTTGATRSMRDHHLAGRSPVYATHGMAATSMPAATLTALDVLRAGGNALDAAVAAVAVLCVIEPQSTGIGGDCFCLYAPAGTGKVHALNGSGRAPAAATIDWYESRQIRAIENTSAHAVTVPGAVNAWETLLAAHGRKGLDELLQPAIRYAAEGWPVHPKVSWDWQRTEPKLRKNDARHFLPNGGAPKPGDLFVQPALAET